MFCCVAGTEVVMGDGVKQERIENLKDGDIVMTIDPKTYKEEPSPIHSCFSKKATDIYKVTTHGGRSVSVTFNHPFLVIKGFACNEGSEWIEAADLDPNMNVLITDTDISTESDIASLIPSRRSGGTRGKWFTTSLPSMRITASTPMDS
jgi:intein/homing endonuclease